MAGIFAKIAAGEIPSYKCAENDKFYAFLDINPLVKGHTLVIPRREVDYIFDLDDDELAEIGKSFGYEYWERVDETHSGVRFCASWATTQENVDALREAVNALKK